MELEVFGDSWELLEVFVRAVIMYVFAVALLRVFGKRTTMTTASFDLILTVALGSILASTVVSPDRPIMQGMVALAALVAAQWLLSLGVSRSEHIQRVVVSPARLLLKDGEVIKSNLLDERLSMEQLEQFIRQQGYTTTSKLEAAVLESNGSVSVIGPSEGDGELVSEKEIGSRAL